MALIAYRLAFNGPIHLGTGRERDLADLDLLPRSDTLAAAIISLWRHVMPDASASDVTRIAADPPFAISSALPTVMIDGNWRTLLFVPAGTFDRVADLPSDLRKTLKRIRFADPDALRALLAGRLPNTAAPCGEALMNANFGGELWHHQSRLRLQVDRLGDRPMEGMLYEFGAVQLDRRVRLTVVIDFIEEGSRRGVEAALALLGDEGIGGDRSSGYGGFEIEQVIEDFGEEFADLGSGARLSLSLLYPATRRNRGRPARRSGRVHHYQPRRMGHRTGRGHDAAQAGQHDCRRRDRSRPWTPELRRQPDSPGGG